MSEAPDYPLGDAPEDGGVEERAWVPTARASADDAVAWFGRRWPEVLETLADDGLELDLARDTAGDAVRRWMHLAPCAGCGGTGAEGSPFWRPDPPGAYGPPPACESCGGTGEQDDGGDAIYWRECQPDEDGAVEFWVLIAEERDR